MREILFRGKRIDNGKWVEGGIIQGVAHELWQNSDKVYIMVFPQYLSRPNLYEVDPTTVGQYTGRTDKNGKRIFEGDIVRISKTLFTVEWRGAKFVFGHIAGQPWSYPYFASYAESCEVIGNIHDNPELLKEG